MTVWAAILALAYGTLVFFILLTRPGHDTYQKVTMSSKALTTLPDAK